MPPRGGQRDGRAVAVAALDAQPVPPQRRLLHLDRVALAAARPRSAARQAVRPQAHQLVQDARPPPRGRRRGPARSARSPARCPSPTLMLDLDLRRQHRQARSAWRASDTIPRSRGGAGPAVPAPFMNDATEQLLHTHGTNAYPSGRASAWVATDESRTARFQGRRRAVDELPLLSAASLAEAAPQLDPGPQAPADGAAAGALRADLGEIQDELVALDPSLHLDRRALRTAGGGRRSRRPSGPRP